MRTTLFYCLLLLGIGAFTQAHAQCTITVTNNTNCMYTFDVDYDDGSGTVATMWGLTVGPFTVLPVTTPAPCVAVLRARVYDAGGGAFKNASVVTSGPGTTDTVGDCTNPTARTVIMQPTGNFSIN